MLLLQLLLQLLLLLMMLLLQLLLLLMLLLVSFLLLMYLLTFEQLSFSADNATLNGRHSLRDFSMTVRIINKVKTSVPPATACPARLAAVASAHCTFSYWGAVEKFTQVIK